MRAQARRKDQEKGKESTPLRLPGEMNHFLRRARGK